MTVDDHGLPAGLEVRRPQPSDAPAVLELVVACDLAGVGSSDATLTEVTADLERPGYDRDRGGLLVLDAEGRAVGWLWTDDHAAAERVFVDPYSLDGDVLGWLLGEGLAYARLVAAERGHRVSVAAGAYESDRLMTRTLAAAGLVPVRHFWRMQIVLDAARVGDDGDGGLARGVTVRRVGESDDEQRLLHRLVTESFRDHWDSAPRTYEDWRATMDAPSGRDPSQWWVASVDGTPAGVLIGDESEAELGISKVQTLGVLRPYRRRGVAKALLRTAFADAQARGRRAVALEVDSESPTGATRLYESVGMAVDKVMVSWRLPAEP